MIAHLAQKDRPLGLMPFDWLMLFTGQCSTGLYCYSSNPRLWAKPVNSRPATVPT